MRIIKNIFNELLETFAQSPIESGGILGEKQGIIVRFSFDNVYTSDREYVPNVMFLNKTIQLWQEQGVHFAGIVHSHPNGLYMPSPDDEKYAKKILSLNSTLNKIFLPIVYYADSVLNIKSWYYDRKLHKDKIKILYN